MTEKVYVARYPRDITGREFVMAVCKTLDTAFETAKAWSIAELTSIGYEIDKSSLMETDIASRYTPYIGRVWTAHVQTKERSDGITLHHVVEIREFDLL